MKLLDLSLLRLQVYSYLDYKEDRSLGSASVISKNMKPLVRRSDSAKHRKPSINIKGDFSKALFCDEFVMKPGVNTFVATRRVNQPGLYKVSQLSLVIEEKLEFLSSVLNPRLCYEVAKTQPTISVKCGRDLLAGLSQDIELVISSGSTKITEEMKLKLRTSRGLTVQSQSVEKVMVKELEIPLPTCEPFQTIKIQLKILAELPPKKDSSSMEHKVFNTYNLYYSLLCNKYHNLTLFSVEYSMSMGFGRKYTFAFWSTINVKYETSHSKTKKIHSNSRNWFDKSASTIN